ncbi:MAG: prenyltransferase/squalene oxidase repeat-containing protein [Akkermansiaceae bacterium]
MKTLITMVATILPLGLATGLQAQEVENPYLSIKLEMKRTIETGNAYLKKAQHADGYWKDANYPAYTALALTAALRSPSYKEAAHVKKGIAWLLKQQKKDGGIYNQGLGTYNTATSIVALVATGDKAHYPAILKARRYLINMQTNPGNLGDLDKKYIGGIGYGGSYKHSDMSNTYLSIEALRLSRHIAQDDANGKQPELDWEAAIQFVSRAQNLKATNDQPGISDDGGFVYFPGNSKAGETENADGSKSLRSYGSMSYAGLLSMVYADLDAKDPRVIAVKKWLGNNYTIKENPGLGQQGLYYYYHTMAKALAAAGVDKLPLKGGGEADWRKDIAQKILTTQREDGSWLNENARWWENQPELVTAYGVLTLEQIYHTIPE